MSKKEKKIHLPIDTNLIQCNNIIADEREDGWEVVSVKNELVISFEREIPEPTSVPLTKSEMGAIAIATDHATARCDHPHPAG